MWFLELLVFAPAMIATNTPFPIPSDAVLLAFASDREPALVIAFATVGAICAGIGGLVELRVLVVDRRDVPRPGRWFYAAVVACAALPIPFTAIRLMLLRGAPRPLWYAGAIAIGRYPRYLAEAFLISRFVAPGWISFAVLGVVGVVLAIRWWR